MAVRVLQYIGEGGKKAGTAETTSHTNGYRDQEPVWRITRKKSNDTHGFRCDLHIGNGLEA